MLNAVKNLHAPTTVSEILHCVQFDKMFALFYFEAAPCFLNGACAYTSFFANLPSATAAPFFLHKHARHCLFYAGRMQYLCRFQPDGGEMARKAKTVVTCGSRARNLSEARS